MANLRRRQVLCIAGHDERSLSVLLHTRAWQHAFATSVRAILVSQELPLDLRVSYIHRFREWVLSTSQLSLSLDDLFACTNETFFDAFEEATAAIPDVVVCSDPPDDATEVGMISLRAIWQRTSSLGASLLIARGAVPPQRILIATDGTARTSPVLKHALDLGEHLDARLSYFDSVRIPWLRSITSDPGNPPSSSATQGDLESAPYYRAVLGIGNAMARASEQSRSDLVVVGISPFDHGTALRVFSAFPCAVLAVPCALPRARW